MESFSNFGTKILTGFFKFLQIFYYYNVELFKIKVS